MIKHILIATDGSDRSERAIRLGVDLAKAVGGRITALMTTWPAPPVYIEGMGTSLPNEELEENARRFAMRSLAVAQDAAANAGVPCESIHLRRTHPHEAILETAQSKGCDLIVMASHGRAGASALLLGSETQKVLAHAKIPVLVCK